MLVDVNDAVHLPVSSEIVNYPTREQVPTLSRLPIGPFLRVLRALGGPTLDQFRQLAPNRPRFDAVRIHLMLPKYVYATTGKTQRNTIANNNLRHSSQLAESP